MRTFEGRFAGRTAIVTGGASGLGKAAARRIVAEGGIVALWDLNVEALETAKDEIGAAHIAALNVAELADVEAAAEASLAVLRKVDILICSAGITGATAPVHEFPVQSWINVMSVNVDGLFYCNRTIVPLMLANGYGRIVNVSSVAGKEGNPNASAYSASKAAVIGFTKSLGKELAKDGITVNAIAPATVDTPILAQVSQAHIDYMRSKIPMGRFGTVDELASIITWLASEECSFTTGAVFDISGGRATY